MAQDEFFVGFTDASAYHKQDSVSIRALGYQSGETATLTINYTETGTTVFSGEVNASSQGVITYDWVVPDNAQIGNYNLTITSQSSSKSILDSQNFTVPGYPIQLRTLNLAGTPVPQISLEALDQASNAVYNGTSDVNGTATINLERGSHTINAFWNGVKVGELNVSITKAGAYDLTCGLTTLTIIVQDKNGLVIPFVGISLSFQYVTTKTASSETGQASGQTDLSGTFSFNSALAGIDYSINASIYGIVFSTQTISNLPAQPFFQAIIVCPTKNLSLKVLDYTLAPISTARIEFVEQTSGIFYGATTGNDGTVALDITIGKYQLRIYANDVLLNETLIDVFNDTSSQVRCNLYNIRVSVTVVDYFGQSIPNVNVTLNGPGRETLSEVTPTDGTATFNHIIGGNMQIVAYPKDIQTSYIAVNLQVEAATALTIKMAKYVVLGPFLIETTALATFILILAAILLFLSIEVYRRRRAKLNNKKAEGAIPSSR